jgi:RNA polymerase sigma-70 factor (ECF subfamily)
MFAALLWTQPSWLVVFSKSKEAGPPTTEKVAVPASSTTDGPVGPAEVPDFATVYDAYFAFVWRLCANCRVPASHLDDVVQETFLAIHRKLPSFEGRSSLRTWIASVTRITAVEFLRRKRHQVLGSDVDPDASASAALNPAEQLEASAAALLLDQFLDELPEDQRDIFLLAEVEQMTAIEIGDVLEMNPNTVRTRLRAARTSVQASLARHRAAERWRDG